MAKLMKITPDKTAVKKQSPSNIKKEVEYIASKVNQQKKNKELEEQNRKEKAAAKKSGSSGGYGIVER
jgi:hypothetical protein